MIHKNPSELMARTGINFQKASATLDGCVKVWTSRVDSVATETGRLLSGLAGGGGEKPSLCYLLHIPRAISHSLTFLSGDTEEEREEGEEGDEEEPGAEGPAKRKVRLLPNRSS